MRIQVEDPQFHQWVVHDAFVGAEPSTDELLPPAGALTPPQQVKLEMPADREDVPALKRLILDVCPDAVSCACIFFAAIMAVGQDKLLLAQKTPLGGFQCRWPGYGFQCVPKLFLSSAIRRPDSLGSQNEVCLGLVKTVCDCWGWLSVLSCAVSKM